MPIRYAKATCEHCGDPYDRPARTDAGRTCSEACRVALYRREHPKPAQATTRPCEWCGDTVKQPRFGRRKWCDACRKRSCSIWARGRQRAIAAGARWERFSVAEIFSRADHRCAGCGERIDMRLRHPDPWSPALRHVVPFAAGGEHVATNVEPVHLGCNARQLDASMPLHPTAGREVATSKSVR